MTRRVFMWIAVLAAVMATGCGGGDSTGDDAGGVDDDTAVDPTEVTTTVAPAPDDPAPAPPDTPTTVSGEALTPFDTLADDPAVGQVAPLVAGVDLLSGALVEIEASSRPMVVAFFAHWCPHCQREVDDLTAWLETNSLPEGIDLVAVSTFEDATRGNHPPAAWLGKQGWPFPVIADTPGLIAAEAFGVTAVPFFVFVDGDGVVQGRVSGNIGPERLNSLMEQAATGLPQGSTATA